MLRRLKANRGTNKTLFKLRLLDNFTAPIRSMSTVSLFGRVTLMFWTTIELENREISQQTWCVALVSITQASRAISECEKEEEKKILPVM